ncbi:MAG: hypothetical protein ACOYNI_04410 [Acidimicrobiia bacterium]
MSWAFEHLRSLVRHGGTTGRELAIDVAQCLESFDDDAALVMALRRACAQRRDEAPMWWVAARVLCAANSRGAAIEAADALMDDPTLDRVADALPFPHDQPVAVVGDAAVVADLSWRRPDLDLVSVRLPGGGTMRALREAGASVRVVGDLEVSALEPSHVLAVPGWATPDGAWLPSGARAVLDTNATADRWLLVPRGRALPPALGNTMASRLDPLDATLEDTPLVTFGSAVGPHGRGPVCDVVAATDCPVAAELLRLD